jgi:hypothetical protein
VDSRSLATFSLFQMLSNASLFCFGGFHVYHSQVGMELSLDFHHYCEVVSNAEVMPWLLQLSVGRLAHQAIVVSFPHHLFFFRELLKVSWL